MRTNWNCPNCQKSSTRHWNMQRHIDRRHGGVGEPVNDDTIQYYTDMNPQNLRFPLGYSHNMSLSFLTQKEKPHKNFSNLLEDQFLSPLRKVIEFKNLVGQLSTIQSQQQMIIPGDGGVYSSTPSMTSDRGESKNNLSEQSRFHDYDSELAGYIGQVCQRCLVIDLFPIYPDKDGQSGQIETTHRCNYKRLADAQLELDKDKKISDLYERLPQVLKNAVKSWTKNSTYIVAIEIPQNAPICNYIEIIPNDEKHWAARAIKDNQTIVNDEELSDFLHKVKDSTCAFFKVLRRHEQQQESSTRHYLMMITNHKI